MARLLGLLGFAGILLLVVAVPDSGQAARETGAEVLDVRVAVHDDGTTRFVLELSEGVPYTVTQISGGVAIDTPALDWRSRAAGLLRPVGLVNGFTYGTPKAGAGRLTIYTAGSAVVLKAFVMPAGATGAYRLVVDLGLPPDPPPPQARPAPTDNPITGHGGPPAAIVVADPPPAPSSKPPIQQAVAEVPAVSEPGRDHGKESVKDHGKPVIVIDAGHGGVDPGTTGLSGEFEKDIVLPLAIAVKERLDRDGKVRCLLTRSDDTFIPLQERVAIARGDKADLFMSLHADSEADPQIRGLSVYTLSKTASDANAQALADKENKADLVAGLDLAHASPEVTSILLDLVQRETLNLSAVFAGLVLDEAGRETHLLEYGAHRFAGFAVLKAPDVPSVLVETGYLSNRQDEQLLRRPEYRAKLAAALARAVERYFAKIHAPRHG